MEDLLISGCKPHNITSILLLLAWIRIKIKLIIASNQCQIRGKTRHANSNLLERSPRIQENVNCSLCQEERKSRTGNLQVYQVQGRTVARLQGCENKLQSAECALHVSYVCTFCPYGEYRQSFTSCVPCITHQLLQLQKKNMYNITARQLLHVSALTGPSSESTQHYNTVT